MAPSAAANAATAVGHTAQIRLKRGGKVIHTEAQTFDCRPAAAAWLKKREG